MRAKTFRWESTPQGTRRETAGLPIEVFPPPKVVLLCASISARRRSRWSRSGTEVTAGQKIAEAQGMVSAALHASISGKVTAIKERPHPAGEKSTGDCH